MDAGNVSAETTPVRRRPHMKRAIVGALCLLALAGCKREAADVVAPPRSDSVPPIPSESSLVTAPVEVDAEVLRRAVEDAVPRTLWSINQHFERCVPPQRVKLLGARIKLAPKIGCDVIGKATRGRIRLRGNGRDIIAELPIHATISARDVGGVLKGETATGSAMAQAVIRLDLAPDWTPKATVRLRYDWTRAPGIDFLGRRIEFTRQADEKLKPIVRQLERTLPRQLARLQLRPKAEQIWQSAFRTMPVNGENPPVWMRLSPEEPIVRGYALQGRTIRLELGLKAVTETFVGEKPADPTLVPLPAPSKSGGEDGLRFFIPVVADYAELEPVIARALAKRANRPFEVPKIGPVDATFGNVKAYGTDDGRIAVGVTITATPQSGILDKTTGEVWLTALPVNESGSAQVSFTGLAVSGDIHRTGGQMLIDLANGPSVIGAVEGSLTQNFSRDLDGLVEKVRTALADRREGDFRIRADLNDVEIGKLEAYGQGLYLPVRASGTARINYFRR